jgi:putative DNA primase/helicase
MYATTHYFTITADHLSETPLIINERQAVQQRLYENLTPAYTPDKTENTGVWVRSEYAPFTRSDGEIIEKAKTAGNGARFTALWKGSIAGYATKSEADFALVLLLLYWTDDDTAQTDRLFRQSGLMDEKWNRRLGKYTYGQVTIRNALKKRSMKRS